MIRSSSLMNLSFYPHKKKFNLRVVRHAVRNKNALIDWAYKSYLVVSKMDELDPHSNSVY